MHAIPRWPCGVPPAPCTAALGASSLAVDRDLPSSTSREGSHHSSRSSSAGLADRAEVPRMPQPRRRLVWARAIAPLALMALGFPPPSARAGCVHDALLRTLEPTGSSHFRWLVALKAIAPTMGDADAASGLSESEPPWRPRPCSGPSCSSQDGFPPAPGVAVEPTTGSWAWLGPIPTAVGPGPELHAFPGLRPRPSRTGPSVFHPPRRSVTS